jgi:hypothetical protein
MNALIWKSGLQNNALIHHPALQNNALIGGMSAIVGGMPAIVVKGQALKPGLSPCFGHRLVSPFRSRASKCSVTI